MTPALPDNDYWLRCWEQGGEDFFHQPRVLPLLQKHWPALALPAGSRVLVPLCGKSLDMHWLAAQGHRVLGVELSPVAVAAFFAEAGLSPQRSHSAWGEHWRAGAIEIVCGDAFALTASGLADVAGVYDRGALVALPAVLRRCYLDTVYAGLPAGCRGLLLTLEYPQAEMDGPPFDLGMAEVRQILADWSPILLERRDLLAGEPRYRARGLSRLHTAAWQLAKASTAD